MLQSGEAIWYDAPGSKLSYFTFTLPASARVEFTCTSLGASDAESGAKGWFTLYDSNGVKLDIIQDGSNSGYGNGRGYRSHSFWALPEGSYTIEYLPHCSWTHSIMLLFWADVEVAGHYVPSYYVPGGEYRSVERAACIPTNREVFGTTYWAFADSMNNVLVDGKYYQFTLTERSRVKLRADILRSVTLLAMVDSEGDTVTHPVTGKELLGQSDGSAGDNIITVDCGIWKPGTYYLIVASSDPNAWGAFYTVEVMTTPAGPFLDTPADAWFVAQGAIDYVVDAGIMSGYTNASGNPTGKFGPNDSITRGQVATILYRMAGQPYVAGVAPFYDVSPGYYYSDAVIWAYSVGIVSGYTDASGSLTGEFGPNDKVTREQLAKMLGGYAAYMGEDVESDCAAAMRIKGWAKVSEYAKPWIGWVVDAGIMSGKTQKDGSSDLDPRGNATRAEAAKMIMVLDRDVL